MKIAKLNKPICIILMHISTYVYAAPTTINEDILIAEKEAILSLLACTSDYRTMLEMASHTDSMSQFRLTKLKTENKSVVEYKTSEPFEIAGYQTNRIAFISSSIRAVLDEPDTKQLAKKLSIPPTFDLPTLFSGKKVLEFEKKYLGSTEILQETALVISNFSFNPSKTYLGCNYRIQIQ